MNNQHASMKFTSEFESNDIFSFLDIKIIRENNKFSTSVYRKPTFSGVFTHYSSFIDETYKKSLLFTLLFRCYSICSSFEKLHEEIEILRDIFKRNSYPSILLDQCIKTFFQNLYIPKKG